jgi:hypothetical protein
MSDGGTVQSPDSPTNQTVDERGYGYVETAEWWKEACEVLPSFSEVWWPDYSTKVIEDTINGQPVVIQLWKGWCQKFLGRSDFPGGIGAEVGVYHRVPGKVLPTNLPNFPSKMAAYVLGGLAKLDESHLWWAFPELNTTINFELINPKTNEPFLLAGPEVTYWMNKWMNPGSYEQYKSDQGGKVPLFAAEYVLNYQIGDKTYAW